MESVHVNSIHTSSPVQDLHDLKKELLQEINSMKEKAKKLPEAQKARAMGLGELGNVDMIFVREFRWTLQGKNLNEVCVRNVSFDFVSKTMNLELLECMFAGEEISAHQWLESDLSKEKLIFTTYDGCGIPIYEYEISNIRLLSDDVRFDYTSSEVVARKVTICYDNLKRTLLCVKDKAQNSCVQNHSVLSSKEPRVAVWKLEVNDHFVYELQSVKRPTMDIEETELSFLNGKTWLPGKSKWNDMEFVISSDDKLVSCLATDLTEGCDTTLKLYDGYNKVLEVWRLKDCKVKNMSRLNESDAWQFIVKIESAKVEVI